MRNVIRCIVASFVCAVLISIIGYRYFSASPGPFMEDDSYFYAQIAYNIGTLHRSTFDGIHITDGYHLLWGWLLGSVSFLLSFITLNKDIHLITYLSFYLFVVFFTATYIGRTWSEKILLVFVSLWSAWLMESALLSIALLIIIQPFISIRERDRRDDCALLFLPLIRIDASLIVLTWLILFYTFTSTRYNYLRSGLLVVAGMIAQLLFMKVVFGHFTSVSSEIKAGHVLNIIANIRHNFGDSKRLGLIFLFFIVCFVTAWRMENRRSLILAALGPAVFICLHLVGNSDIKSWYTTPVLVCFIYIAFSGTKAFAITTLSYCVTLFILATRIYYSYHMWPIAKSSAAFAIQIAKIIPQQSVVFHTDGAGYIGYHSGRCVINGDGLMNTHEYAKGLREHTLSDYLYKNGVNYIILNFLGNLDNVLHSYGGMRFNKVELVTQTSAYGLPENIFWNYRLYRLEQ